MSTSQNAKSADTSSPLATSDLHNVSEQCSLALQELIVHPTDSDVAARAHGQFQKLVSRSEWSPKRLNLLSVIKSGLRLLSERQLDPGQSIPYFVSCFDLLRYDKGSDVALSAATYELETLFPNISKPTSPPKAPELITLKIRK